jgi:lipoyl-dependent peroxiredoxin
VRLPAVAGKLSFMKTQRKASAEWHGGLKDGKGAITTGSGVLQATQYSFATRFENGKGTNPEELVAAAHAGCFAMALSMILGLDGLTADTIRAEATVTLEKVGEGFEVTSSHLVVRAKVPGADSARFDKAAQAAKSGCPISKLLKAEITMDSALEG